VELKIGRWLTSRKQEKQYMRDRLKIGGNGTKALASYKYSLYLVLLLKFPDPSAFNSNSIHMNTAKSDTIFLCRRPASPYHIPITYALYLGGASLLSPSTMSSFEKRTLGPGLLLCSSYSPKFGLTLRLECLPLTSSVSALPLLSSCLGGPCLGENGGGG